MKQEIGDPPKKRGFKTKKEFRILMDAALKQNDEAEKQEGDNVALGSSQRESKAEDDAARQHSDDTLIEHDIGQPNGRGAAREMNPPHQHGASGKKLSRKDLKR